MEYLMTFDNTPNTGAGLVTKSKTEILADLITMSQSAFGADMNIDEGSSWYIYLDTLANSLDGICSAAKELYNAQGLINAYGANLDNAASLCGIYRKTYSTTVDSITTEEAESDEVFRFRANRALYSTATSVPESMESALLDLSYVKYARIIDNTTSADKIISTNGTTIATIPPHTIWIILDVDLTGNNDIVEAKNIAISKKIMTYKSLGCGTYWTGAQQPRYTYTPEGSDVSYGINFESVIDQSTYITVTLSWATDSWITSTVKNDIRKKIGLAIKSYIDSNVNIGEDILNSKIINIIANTNTYEDFVFDTNTVYIDADGTTTNKKLEIAPNQIAVTDVNKIIIDSVTLATLIG